MTYNSQEESDILYILTKDLNESELESFLYELKGRELIHKYVINGYKDASAGYYDKWYRYNTECEDAYLTGVLLAQYRGFIAENIIECN